MTTTISLPTRNCIALGCDSLATVSRSLITSWQLRALLFNDDGSRKLGADGRPIELTNDMLTELSEDVPYNQIPTVTKLFSLDPLFAGLLFAGVASIGGQTIRNLVDDFKASQPFRQMKNAYTISHLTDCLRDFILPIYQAAKCYDVLEIIVSGYSKKSHLPEIRKITITPNGAAITEENKEGEFKMVYGGQTDVIQRVVTGWDVPGFVAVMDALRKALSTYRGHIVGYLAKEGFTKDVPEWNAFVSEMHELYGGYIPFQGTFTRIEQFSEQAAIDFVDFLIELTIKSQQFSNRLPTVGGDIHVALITYSQGFKWISKEEYKFRGTTTPKDGEGI